MTAGRRRALEALGLAAVVTAAGVVYARSFHTRANFDEGVYLASVDALRHGQALGTEVDIPQPPGFYVVLRAMALVLTDSVAGMRVGFFVLALVGLAAAWAVGRKVAGTWGGLGAASLVAVTAPFPAQAVRVQADTVSTVLALASIAVLMTAGRRRLWVAAVAGVLAGVALSLKLLALPVLVPLAVLVIGRRSWRQGAAVAGGAIVAFLALLLPYAYALSDLWESVVLEHRRAQSLGPGLGDNAERVFGHPLDWHTPAAVLVPLGLVLTVLLVRRVETLALGAWIVASALFLLYQRPLLDHHLVLLAVALGVPAGIGLGAAAARLDGPARAVAVSAVALALAAGFVQEHRRLARNDEDEPVGVRWAASQLRERTRPDQLVGTDLPIVAYLADRRVAGQLIDASYGRLRTNTLTTGEILDELADKRVRAVVVGRLYREKPDLLAALRDRYPTRLASGGVTLYLAP